MTDGAKIEVRRVEQLDWSADTGPAAVVRRIAAAAAAEAGRDVIDEAAELALAHRGLEGAVLLLAGPAGSESDSDVAGFAYLRGLSGAGRPELDIVVHPDLRGRGVGSALVAHVIELVGHVPVTAWSHGDHPAARRLAEDSGMTPVRELWVMRRRAQASASPAVREGVTLRGFEPGDEEDILAVNAAAFADHPEQGQLDLDGLRERMDQPWFDPAGLLVGILDGRLRGFHWTKVHPPEVDETVGKGEVYVIGVHPEAQGSGLGQALLHAGLAHLEASGVPEVLLYVEGDNHGAIRLYEAVGFTHADVDTDVMYATTD